MNASFHRKRVAIEHGTRVFTILGIVCVMAATALAESKLSGMNSLHDSAQEKSSLIVTSDYTIGPEDVLEISVWRNADLSKIVEVRPDGRISLPLIGDVTAVGKTASQLAETISMKLKEYKENPQVSIVVKEVHSYVIYVLGEVAHTGKFPLKSKTTLLQAVTIAGGFTPVAARNKIVVFRFAENGEKDVKIRASYDDIVLRDATAQNILLKPGDTIVVPSENMVLIP
jgi:polysaccharide biosynthesis/export protein